MLVGATGTVGLLPSVRPFVRLCICLVSPHTSLLPSSVPPFPSFLAFLSARGLVGDMVCLIGTKAASDMVVVTRMRSDLCIL
jgi:hypothetical protein